RSPGNATAAGQGHSRLHTACNASERGLPPSPTLPPLPVCRPPLVGRRIAGCPVQPSAVFQPVGRRGALSDRPLHRALQLKYPQRAPSHASLSCVLCLLSIATFSERSLRAAHC